MTIHPILRCHLTYLTALSAGMTALCFVQQSLWLVWTALALCIWTAWAFGAYFERRRWRFAVKRQAMRKAVNRRGAFSVPCRRCGADMISLHGSHKCLGCGLLAVAREAS